MTQEALPGEAIEMPASADDGVLVPTDGETASDSVPESAAQELFQGGVAPDDGDDGIELPLWQLEIALGLLAVILGGTAVVMARRR